MIGRRGNVREGRGSRSKVSQESVEAGQDRAGKVRDTYV